MSENTIEVLINFSGTNVTAKGFDPRSSLSDVRRVLETEDLIEDKLFFQNPRKKGVAIPKHQEGRWEIAEFRTGAIAQIELLYQNANKMQEFEEESKESVKMPQGSRIKTKPAIDEEDITKVGKDQTIVKLGQKDILSLLKKINFLKARALQTNMQLKEAIQNLFEFSGENVRLSRVQQGALSGHVQSSKITAGKDSHKIYSQGYWTPELEKEMLFLSEVQSRAVIQEDPNDQQKYYVYAEISFPKITLNLSDIRSELSDRAAGFFNQFELKRPNVFKFLETFGDFVPESVTLGGKYWITHDVTSSTPTKRIETQSQIEKDLYNAVIGGRLQDLKQKYTFDCIGGNKLLKDSPKMWIKGLETDWSQWEIIKVESWGWSYDYLDDSLRVQIMGIIRTPKEIKSHGDKYQGGMVNGKKEGKGTMVYKNNDVYSGDWKNDQFEGHGKYTWKSGDQYTGGWVNGRREGKGTMYYKNGDKCDGDWVNDKIEGKAKFTWKDGRVYDGEWINSQRHGKGTYIWTTKDKYEGEWRNNKFNGYGIYTWADGRRYEGMWANDWKQGEGIMKWPNGLHYQGTWVQNKMEGNGTLSWDAGASYYQGEWKNHKKEGKGKMILKSGEVYEGDWLNDRKHGKGEQKYTNGDVYIGSWVNNTREGKGKINFASGDVYEGDFLNNKMEGVGTFNWGDGRVYTGSWVNGKREGKGKLVWKNGEKYEGDWVNQRMEGRGKYTWTNGKTYDGEWMNNQPKK